MNLLYILAAIGLLYLVYCILVLLSGRKVIQETDLMQKGERL